MNYLFAIVGVETERAEIAEKVSAEELEECRDLFFDRRRARVRESLNRTDGRDRQKERWGIGNVAHAISRLWRGNRLAMMPMGSSEIEAEAAAGSDRRSHRGARQETSEVNDIEVISDVHDVGLQGNFAAFLLQQG